MSDLKRGLEEYIWKCRYRNINNSGIIYVRMDEVKKVFNDGE